MYAGIWCGSANYWRAKAARKRPRVVMAWILKKEGVNSQQFMAERFAWNDNDVSHVFTCSKPKASLYKLPNIGLSLSLYFSFRWCWGMRLIEGRQIVTHKSFIKS